jgi:hypothetical protein
MNDSSATNTTVEGRCLCFSNHFRVAGHCTGMVHCHCQRCRKAHGASVVSWTYLDEATFEWRSRGDIGHFQSSEPIRRSFCLNCGSTVPDPDLSGSGFGFPMGNVLSMPRPEPEYHFYTASKAPWTRISPDAEQFEVVSDRFKDPGLDDLDRSGPATGVGGSCLCGEVVFEAGDPALMMNCHCTRCRLSRAAAHATNLFVPRETLSFVRGRERVRSYKVPEADRFAVGFCEQCGGLVPRPDSDSDYANIPAGSLDGDPGVEPAGHIWTGSKADWWEIGDDLPRWEERRG